MALQPVHQGVTMVEKRKHPGEPDDAITPKRPRDDSVPTISPLLSQSAQPLQTLIAELSPRYNIKSLSIISSSNIAKRVDSVLNHLGRISAWDPSVLPGVVLLYARATSTNKLITVADLVRRRIHEAEQKWYQYNRLYEMGWEVVPKQQGQQGNNKPPQQSQDHKVETMIEDTVMSMDDGGGGGKGSGHDDDDGDGDDFEVMATPQPQQTVFERAVHGEDKTSQMAHMSIFLSRIPIPELRTREGFAEQSNEVHINRVQKKRAGLVA